MNENIREKSLMKNTIIITIGTMCTKLITFLLLPLYTGILSTEEYGIVDLLNTLASLMLPIVTFQVEQAVFRDLIEVRDDFNKKKGIISSSIFSVIIQCAVYLILFFTVSPFIKNDYKIFLATNVIVYIFSSLFLQIARGLGDNKKYSIASFVSALFTIVFNVIFLVIIKLRVNGMLFSTLIGQTACTLYLFIYLKLYKYISIKAFNWKIVKKLWKYSLPLIPNAISWWVFGSSDRVIVSIFLGLSMNGILSAASKFSGIYITLYNIFNMSWTESIALHINDSDIDSYFNKMFEFIIKIFISLAIIMITFMPFIYPLMINVNYSYGYVIVPILILGSLFNVVVGLISVIYVAKKNTKAIANTSIVSALMNIAIHLLLIKYIGLYAAAISTFVSYFVMSIYRVYDINKKYIKIKLNKKLIASTALIIAVCLMLYYLNNLYLNIVSIMIGMIYSVIINKDSVQLIFKTLKNKLIKTGE